MTIQAKIFVSDFLTPLDYLVIIAITIITCLSVIYGHYLKKTIRESNTHSMLEYLLMGRQLTLPLFIATLTATWYGGIFGVTQNAFNHGIYNLVTQGLFWYLSYIVFALFIAEKIRHSKVVTLPELIKKRYGHHSSIVAAILIFFKTLPITSAISIGIFLRAFLPISLELGIIIGVTFVMLYSVWGGFRAVVFSDLIQFITMLAGVFLVVYFSVAAFGGYNFLTHKLPTSHFSFTSNYSLSTTISWLIIAFATTFINPAFYQRCFAAKNSATVKYGILCSTLIWFIFDICTTLGGMYARAVIPEAESIDAYLFYSIQILPNGYRGLFIASIIATILSTLDSFLNLSSSIIAYDLMPKHYRNTRITHLCSLFCIGLLTIIIAIYFCDDLENMWRFIKSYYSACLLTPIFISSTTKAKLSNQVFLSALISSCSAMSLYYYFDLAKYCKIDAMYIGILTSCSVFLWCMTKNASSRYINKMI